MPTQIVNTAKKATRVVNTSARPHSAIRVLDGATVAKALGAQATGYSLGSDNNPITLYQMRGELARLLTSAGGRPSLAGAQDKVKIPRFSQDWAKIEALADTAAVGMTFRPSPAQVAAVLLHEALERFSEEDMCRVVSQRIAA